jgi:hypothetical protein
MHWWLEGDKSYLELRADGSLAYLYAIRPDHQPVTRIGEVRLLAPRLATAADVSPDVLATFDTGFLWVRGNAGDLPPTDILSLAYCATNQLENSWSAWCVDAASGELIATGNGYD